MSKYHSILSHTLFFDGKLKESITEGNLSIKLPILFS